MIEPGLNRRVGQMGGYLMQVTGRLFYGSQELLRPFFSPKASRLGEKPREDFPPRFPRFHIRHGSLLRSVAIQASGKKAGSARRPAALYYERVAPVDGLARYTAAGGDGSAPRVCEHNKEILDGL
ncbi:MAG: hypothetical protein IIC33_03085 [Chloroflexi bacterium]|nr:hypothetical protein [Chloroflexota bacterium]